jgi:collagen type XXI alpha
VFVSTQRFKVKKVWDLWRILTIDGRPQMAVTLNGVERTLSFTTTSVINGSQTVTFADSRVKVKMAGWSSLYGSAQGCGVGRERESYGFNMTKRY